PCILFVGNLHPRKNLARLVQAFVLLKNEKHIPAKLKIVGQNHWRNAELFSVVRKHRLESEVEFTGYLDQASLIRCYQSASVMAYPSLYEGFGFPVLEAMACGCPVVTSKTSSLPEVAGGA